MSKYIILYRIKNEYDGCRYIELKSDGTIRLDCSNKPIVSNARCCTRIYEDFDDVETWLTEDVFNRMANVDGNDTFACCCHIPLFNNCTANLWRKTKRQTPLFSFNKNVMIYLI